MYPKGVFEGQSLSYCPARTSMMVFLPDLGASDPLCTELLFAQRLGGTVLLLDPVTALWDPAVPVPCPESTAGWVWQGAVYFPTALFSPQRK